MNDNDLKQWTAASAGVKMYVYSIIALALVPPLTLLVAGFFLALALLTTGLGVGILITSAAVFLSAVVIGPFRIVGSWIEKSPKVDSTENPM